MRYDDILKHIGEFGRYQKYVYTLISLLAIPCAWHSLGNTFLSASPEHYCRSFPGQEYEEFSSTKNCTIPYKNGEWVSCDKFNRTLPYDGCSSYDADVIRCDQGWVYDTTFYESTAVSQWDLVCADNSKRQLSKSLVLVGKMVGSAIFGQLADFFGRKPMFLIGIIMQVSIGIGASFSPSFEVFCTLQFLLGVTASGVFVVALVIVTELVGPSKRAFAGIAIEYFYSIGYMSIALIGWRMRSWSYIEFCISAPPALFLVYYWLVPESPRWLISKGRKEEAMVILQQAAKINKVALPENILDYVNVKEEKKSNLPKQRAGALDLIRTPNMRLKTLIIYFAWIANSMVYYGLSFFTEDLGSDPYVAFFISGAVEIPAYILCQLLLDRLGRRRVMFGFMMVGSIALFCCLPIPNDLENVTLAISMIGKLCISGSYAIVYLYAAELFPTPIRNVGVGMGSFSARIGSILSPYILLLADIVSPTLPLVIFASFSFVAGVMVLMLPETLGRKLPETLEEGENIGKGLSIWQRIKGDSNDAFEEKTSNLAENVDLNQNHGLELNDINNA